MFVLPKIFILFPFPFAGTRLAKCNQSVSSHAHVARSANNTEDLNNNNYDDDVDDDDDDDDKDDEDEDVSIRRRLYQSDEGDEEEHRSSTRPKNHYKATKGRPKPSLNLSSESESSLTTMERVVKDEIQRSDLYAEVICDLLDVCRKLLNTSQRPALRE